MQLFEFAIMIIENFATLREEIQSVSITYDVVY